MVDLPATARRQDDDYTEGNAEVRFKIRGVRRIFFYCNRDGLISIDPVPQKTAQKMAAKMPKMGQKNIFKKFKKVLAFFYKMV